MFEPGVIYSLSVVAARLRLTEYEAERLRQHLNGKAASIDEHGIVYYRGCDLVNSVEEGVARPQQLASFALRNR